MFPPYSKVDRVSVDEVSSVNLHQGFEACLWIKHFGKQGVGFAQNRLPRCAESSPPDVEVDDESFSHVFTWSVAGMDYTVFE